jgi:hypothetical protein
MATPYTPSTGKSLDEIAAMMAANRDKMQAQKEERNAGRKPGVAARPVTQLDEVEDAEILEEDALIGETPDEEDDAADEEGGDGTDADADGDGADTDEDGVVDQSEEDGDELEIDDDTLLELEEGEEPISLKTLKEVYKADKEIPKKIAAIEAEYQAAAQTRSKAVEDGTKMNEAMRSLIQAVDQVLSQPMVKKPADTPQEQQSGSLYPANGRLQLRSAAYRRVAAGCSAGVGSSQQQTEGG